MTLKVVQAQPVASKGPARIVQIPISAGAITMGVLLTAALFALLHGLLQIGGLVDFDARPALQVDLVRVHAAKSPDAEPVPLARIDGKRGDTGGKPTEFKITTETTSETTRSSDAQSLQTPTRKPARSKRKFAKQDEHHSHVERQVAQVGQTVKPVTDSPSPSPSAVSASEPSVALGPKISSQMAVMHRPAPRYPRRARRRGIEGEVTVGFTVTSTGSVESVRVIEASPKGYFEDAALEAARQFRFAPRRIAGEPIAVADVRNRFSFRLQN